MASAQTPENRVHLFRLQILLVDGGNFVIRNIFNQKLQSQKSTLTVCLAQEKQTIDWLKARKLITTTQYDLLFPQGGQTPSIEDFDLSLTICLLRNLNVCGLNSWKPVPLSTDLSVEADITRLRTYRNEIAHISGTTSFKQQDFYSKWKEIKQILSRLNNSVPNKPVSDLQQMITGFETCTLDQTAEQKLLKEIEVWQEYEKALEEDIQRLKKDVQANTESLQKDVKAVKVDVENFSHVTSKNSDRLEDISNRVDKLENLASKKEANLQKQKQVGLNAAGKTTILYKLKLGEIVTTILTILTIGLLFAVFVGSVAFLYGIFIMSSNTLTNEESDRNGTYSTCLLFDVNIGYPCWYLSYVCIMVACLSAAVFYSKIVSFSAMKFMKRTNAILAHHGDSSDSEKEERTSHIESQSENRWPFEERLEELKKDLILLYKQTAGILSICPTLPKLDTLLEKIYVYRQLYETKIDPITNEEDVNERKATNYSIFKKWKKIVLFADRGCGKTAVVQHIIMTWCQAHKANGDNFDFVFYLDLGKINPDKLDLVFLIKNEICSRLSRSSRFMEDSFIEDILNDKKCLILVDGLDQRQDNPNLKLQGRPWENCTVLTTTSSKEYVKGLSSKEIDIYITIKDLDENTTTNLISNVLKLDSISPRITDLEKNIEQIKKIYWEKRGDTEIKLYRPGDVMGAIFTWLQDGLNKEKVKQNL